MGFRSRSETTVNLSVGRFARYASQRMAIVRLLRRMVLLLALAAGGACGEGGPAGPQTDVPRGTTFLDVTYCRAGAIDLKIDLYFPDPSAPPRAPATLFLHGGGWVGGDKRESGWLPRIREPLLERGYVVASADYRLAPSHRWPAQIEDAKCAIRFLRAEAGTYGIDTDRIGVWGTSAGGHLAALLGTADASTGFEGDGGHAGQSSQVRAVVDLYGPADLTDGEGWPQGQPFVLDLVFGTSDLDSPVLAGASPTTHATPDDPPFLILHGERDRLVPVRQSELLFERLDAVGVPVELVVVENARHGLVPDGGEIRPSEGELVDKVVEFFEVNLR